MLGCLDKAIEVKVRDVLSQVKLVDWKPMNKTQLLHVCFAVSEWPVTKKWQIYRIPARIVKHYTTSFRFPKNGRYTEFPTYRSPIKRNKRVYYLGHPEHCVFLVLTGSQCIRCSRYIYLCLPVRSPRTLFIFGRNQHVPYRFMNFVVLFCGNIIRRSACSEAFFQN